jgi:hypothetical protein
VLVLWAVAELGGELLTDLLTEKKGYGTTTVLLESNLESAGNGVLARVVKTGQENGEALLRTGRIRVTENLYDTLVREPVWDSSTGTQALAELGTADVGGLSTLGNLVDGLVLVRSGKVGHGLERNHVDVELILELGNELLSVVRTVEVLTGAVLAWSSVVTTNNKVGSTKVLADDSVPHSLTGTGHTHSKGKESKVGETVGVGGDESLVGAHTSVVVDISWLGETDDGVDEDVGATLTGGADGELTVSAVHGVTGLESDNLAPGDLGEVGTELGRGDCLSVSVLLILITHISERRSRSE